MILDRIFGRMSKRASESWSTGGWGNSSSGRVQTLAGSRVDEDMALTLSAVCACTRIIVEPISTMPLHLYKRTDDDGREKAIDKSLFDTLDVSPNPEMGAAAFREGRAVHQLGWGQGFAEIVLDQMTDETTLWPIHPSRVRPSLQNSGVDANEFPYLVRNSDGTYVAMRRSELLHIPGMLTEDGIWGKGVIQYARETIGAGFSIERHTAAYWAGGAQPRGIVMLPGQLIKSAEQRAQYRSEWKHFHGSPDSSEVLLLPKENSDYKPIAISNEDSQFLETKKLNVAQIAQFYRVPVYMLGIFEMAAARASIEAQGIEFVMYTLMPWLKKIEEQLNLKLLTKQQRNRYFIEHNVTALLRGDVNARFNAYKTAIANGWMTINQVCRLENLPTIGPAGDVNYIQLNMTTARAMYENPPQPADPSGGKPAAVPAVDGADAEDAADTVGEPKGTDPKALADWTRNAAQRLQARSEGKRGHKIKSAVIHDNAPLKAAARQLLFDVLERFGVKEAKAAERHAGRVKDMMAAIENGSSSIPDGNITTWADGFYPKHQEQIAAAIRSTGEMLIAIDIPFDAAAVAERACMDARLAMEHAFYSDTPETFAKRLAEWPAAFATGGVAHVFGDALA